MIILSLASDSPNVGRSEFTAFELLGIELPQRFERVAGGHADVGVRILQAQIHPGKGPGMPGSAERDDRGEMHDAHQPRPAC